MKTHIWIATTQGPVAIQRLIEEDPDVPSLVCLNKTSKRLPISADYYDFVRKGSGLIERDFGGQSWRMDVSGPVSTGNSWQLAAYLAHYFHRLGQLGDGAPGKGDRLLLATGVVSATREVETIDELQLKLARAAEPIAGALSNGARCFVVLPKKNERDLSEDWREHCGMSRDVSLVTLVNVMSLEHYFEVDDLKPMALGRDTKALGAKRIRCWWLIALALLVLVTGGISWYKSNQDDCCDPAKIELDDFGSEPVGHWKD